MVRNLRIIFCILQSKIQEKNGKIRSIELKYENIQPLVKPTKVQYELNNKRRVKLKTPPIYIYIYITFSRVCAVIECTRLCLVSYFFVLYML